MQKEETHRHKQVEQQLDLDPDARVIEAFIESLKTEHWGEKMRTYRDQAGLRLEDVADDISTVMPTSMMTLWRLEGREKVPTHPRQRFMAALALVVYGVHPSTMGLSLNDVPPSINLNTLRRRGERNGRRGPVTGSSWTVGSNTPEPVASCA